MTSATRTTERAVHFSTRWELSTTSAGRSRPTAARNNFRNVGVDLHLEIADPVRRSTAIAAEIALARDADDEPARIAQRRARAQKPRRRYPLGGGRDRRRAEPQASGGRSERLGHAKGDVGGVGLQLLRGQRQALLGVGQVALGVSLKNRYTNWESR